MAVGKVAVGEDVADGDGKGADCREAAGQQRRAHRREARLDPEGLRLGRVAKGAGDGRMLLGEELL